MGKCTSNAKRGRQYRRSSKSICRSRSSRSTCACKRACSCSNRKTRKRGKASLRSSSWTKFVVQPNNVTTRVETPRKNGVLIVYQVGGKQRIHRMSSKDITKVVKYARDKFTAGLRPQVYFGDMVKQNLYETLMSGDI